MSQRGIEGRDKKEWAGREEEKEEGEHSDLISLSPVLAWDFLGSHIFLIELKWRGSAKSSIKRS